MELLLAAKLAAFEDRKPTLVWILHPEASKKNQAVEECFAAERVALALRRFRCLRAETKSIPDDRLESEVVKQAPLLLFFDPAGELQLKLRGRRASSRSGVERSVRNLWGRSFLLPIRDYLVRMDDLLDRTDAAKRLRVDLDRKKARWKSQPLRLRTLRKKEEQLEAIMMKIVGEQQKIDSACRLREKYRPPKPDEAEEK